MTASTEPYTTEGRKSGEWTYVATMPPCDLCGDGTPATHDARMKQGSWAFMCHHCWARHAMHTTLGVGRGQLLILREEVK